MLRWINVSGIKLLSLQCSLVEKPHHTVAEQQHINKTASSSVVYCVMDYRKNNSDLLITEKYFEYCTCTLSVNNVVLCSDFYYILHWCRDAGNLLFIELSS